MKIQVKTESVVEKEIKLPYFFKHNYTAIRAIFFAVFDEETSMRVGDKEVQCYPTSAISSSITSPQVVEITEEEFTQAFDETMERIQSMLPVTK